MGKVQNKLRDTIQVAVEEKDLECLQGALLTFLGDPMSNVEDLKGVCLSFILNSDIDHILRVVTWLLSAPSEPFPKEKIAKVVNKFISKSTFVPDVTMDSNDVPDTPDVPDSPVIPPIKL